MEYQNIATRFCFSLFLFLNFHLTNEKKIFSALPGSKNSYYSSEQLSRHFKTHSILKRSVTRKGTLDIRLSSTSRDGKSSIVPDDDARVGRRIFSHLLHLNTTFHNEVIIHWIGNKSDVVFVLTKYHAPSGEIASSTLWSSEDNGKSFKKVEGFPEDTVISFFQISKLNRKRVLFIDVKNKRLFITENEGKLWDITDLSFEPDKLVSHPTNENWLLGYSLQARNLYVSRNFGKTWILIQKHVNPKFFWAVTDQDEDNSVIHMEVHDKAGKTFYKACSFPYCTDVTGDMEMQDIVPGSLTVRDEYIFLQKIHHSGSDLYVSHNRKAFEKTYFPGGANPKDYNIIDTSDGQVFIAVSVEDELVNLYLSDSLGRYYTLSLRNVVYFISPGFFEIDLHKVQGMPGTYIVNQHTGISSMSLEGPKTVITYNKGGKWQDIPVPADSRDQCDDLNDCHLHFHLDYSYNLFYIPQVISDKAAPGLVIGHGYVGKALQNEVSQVFISRDGGWTWKKMPYPGNYFMTILDHGGVITAVDHDPRTTKHSIHFTYDEGESWHTEAILQNNDLSIDAVITEPEITQTVLTIFGHMNQQNGWSLLQLDFASILSKPCQNENYEQWTPQDKIADATCILGQKTIFERRKQNSVCYNGREYMRTIDLKSCPCSEEDFQCDFGFEPIDGTCQQADWFHFEEYLEGCSENSTFLKSQGFRKIASDKCVGGLSEDPKYLPKETKCPVIKPAKLTLVPSSNVVASGNSITFTLTQEMGSKDSTIYTWKINDGTQVTIHGFDDAARFSHVFNMRGRYTVSVTASNSAGSSTTAIAVTVEDIITEIKVHMLNGAKVGKPVYFDITIAGRNDSDNFGNVHFAWKFEDGVRSSLLTWDRNVSYIYRKTGIYNVTVEALNAVGSVFHKFHVHVFENVIDVSLIFQSLLDEFVKSETWRYLLSNMMRSNLGNMLAVDYERLVLILCPTSPTTADLSITPPVIHSSHQFSEQEVLERLLFLVRHQDLSISIMGLNQVQITEVKILNQTVATPSPTPSDSSDATVEMPINKPLREPEPVAFNLLPVYIAAPIAFICVVVCVSVVCYYKRKVSEIRQFTLLRSRMRNSSQSRLIRSRNTSESLSEFESDDQTMQINPDFAITLDRNIYNNPNMDRFDISSDDEPGGLVMVTGIQEIDTAQC